MWFHCTAGRGTEKFVQRELTDVFTDNLGQVTLTDGKVYFELKDAADRNVYGLVTTLKSVERVFVHAFKSCLNSNLDTRGLLTFLHTSLNDSTMWQKCLTAWTLTHPSYCSDRQNKAISEERLPTVHCTDSSMGHEAQLSSYCSGRQNKAKSEERLPTVHCTDSGMGHKAQLPGVTINREATDKGAIVTGERQPLKRQGHEFLNDMDVSKKRKVGNESESKLQEAFGSVPNMDELGTSGQKPGTSGQKPGTSGQKPGTSGQKPGTSGQKPGTSGQKPGTSGQKPGTSGQKPGTSGQKPGTSGQKQPDTNGQKHGTSGQKHGTSGQKQGTSGQKQGTSGQKQGTSGQKQSVSFVPDTSRHKSTRGLAAGVPTFRISCKFAGSVKRKLNVQRTASQLGVLVSKCTKWKTDVRNPQIEISIHMNDELTVVGIPLTRDPLSKRSYICHYGLRSSVAWIIAYLAQIQAGDVVLDPMCGKGILLLEAAGMKKNACYMGIDRDPSQLEKAQENVQFAGMAGHVQIIQGDATNVPLAAGSVDTVVTDAPFGQNHATQTDIHTFYKDMLVEMYRILKPGGKMVLLTSCNMKNHIHEWLSKGSASEQSKGSASGQSKDSASEQSKDSASGQSKGSTSEQSKGSASQSKDSTSIQSKDSTSEQSKGSASEQSKDSTSVESKDSTSVESKDSASVESKDSTSEQSKDSTSGQSKDSTSGQSKDSTSEIFNMQDTSQCDISDTPQCDISDISQCNTDKHGITKIKTDAISTHPQSEAQMKNCRRKGADSLLSTSSDVQCIVRGDCKCCRNRRVCTGCDERQTSLDERGSVRLRSMKESGDNSPAVHKEQNTQIKSVASEKGQRTCYTEPESSRSGEIHETRSAATSDCDMAGDNLGMLNHLWVFKDCHNVQLGVTAACICELETITC